MADERQAAHAELEGALAALAALELARPPHLTLSRYLERLVAGGVVSEQSAREFGDAYNRAVYGRGAAGAASADLAGALIEQARAAPAERRAAVGEELAALASVPVAAPVSEEHRDGQRATEETAAESSWDWRREVANDSAAVAAPPPPPGRRFGIGFVIACALLAAIGGYWQHAVGNHQLARLYARSRGLAPPARVRHQLRRLRQQAGDHIDSRGVWRQYATFAGEQKIYPDAILALRHLIARAPDDARLLNELAWLYCRADDLYARDPIQALELAERAHAIDPAPHITDTLAEAAFRNGDVRRAVALAEDVLDRAERSRGFYRGQLLRFRAELPAAESEAAGERETEPADAPSD